MIHDKVEQSRGKTQKAMQALREENRELRNKINKKDLCEMSRDKRGKPKTIRQQFTDRDFGTINSRRFAHSARPSK